MMKGYHDKYKSRKLCKKAVNIVFAFTDFNNAKL